MIRYLMPLKGCRDGTYEVRQKATCVSLLFQTAVRQRISAELNWKEVFPRLRLVDDDRESITENVVVVTVKGSEKIYTLE